jgi:ABC-type nitrate/sulfonate/bicarbonate transport system permease component
MTVVDELPEAVRRSVAFTDDPTPGWRIWLRNRERALLGALGVGVLLLIWELAPRLGLTDPLFSSSPLRVLTAGREYMSSPLFLEDLKVSGTEFGVGLGAAVVTGIPMGLLMGWYRRFEYSFDYILSFAYTAPRVALMPLMILWFGIGMSSKIALVYTMAVFPVIINTMVGVKTVDDSLLQVARSFAAKDRQIFRTVILPASVPSIISGIRLGLGLALIGVVVGEFVAANAGVGHRIQEASTFFRTDLVFFGLFLIAGSGVVLTELLRRVESRFDKWRPGN